MAAKALVSIGFLAGCQTLAPAPAAPVPVASPAIEAGPLRAALGSVGDVRVQQRLKHLADRLTQRSGEIDTWVLPVIQSYLPPNSVVPSRVLLGMHLSRPVAVSGEHLIVDVAAPTWADRSLWTGIQRGLYLRAYAERRPPLARTVPYTAEEFSELLLDQLQRQGLAAYVAGHGANLGSSSKDFNLATPREAIELRVQIIQESVREVRASLAPAAAWRALKQQQDNVGAFAFVGAYMAKVIEERSGKDALVRTIELGPKAFYSAYNATEPGALLYIPLPATLDRVRPETVAH